MGTPTTWNTITGIPVQAAEGFYRLRNSVTGAIGQVEKSAGQPITLDYAESSFDTSDPDPGGGDYPDWWPSVDAPTFICTTAAEVNTAMDALEGVGGFITLSDQNAITAFLNRLTASGLRGHPDSRVVIQTGGGENIEAQVKNLRGQCSDLCFYNLTVEPTSHNDTFAFKLHGPHARIMFLDTNVTDWKQVIESKTDDSDIVTRYPTDFEFVNGTWTKIFNSASPVQSNENQNNKAYRSQGAWFQGKDWRFSNVTATGIGWDIAGDPTRTKTDKFSQLIYIGQSATGIILEGCTFDGTANNMVVCKGTNLTIRDGCIFDRCVNAVSLGTNEAPVFNTSATIDDLEIKRLVPLNILDDGDLDDDLQIKANSGVAFSIVNVDGVSITNVDVTGTNTGRRNSFLFCGNGKDVSMPASDITVDTCDTGDLDIGEVRDFRMPTDGLEVAMTNMTIGGLSTVLVRNTIDTDGTSITAGEIVAEWTLDGVVVGTR